MNELVYDRIAALEAECAELREQLAIKVAVIRGMEADRDRLIRELDAARNKGTK